MLLTHAFACESTSFDVVFDVPDQQLVDPFVELRVEGHGDLWLGYAVLERVTDDVQPTPLE